MPAYRFELPDHSTLEAPHDAGPFSVGDYIEISDHSDSGGLSPVTFRVASVTHAAYRYSGEALPERAATLFDFGMPTRVRLVHSDNETDGVSRSKL